ncbi:MAG: hypothetical protein GY761_06350, partial [Hyphomicrobiales bacterium]|nr:hypothetical protein [Hyphomicrobiales bacterium]
EHALDTILENWLKERSPPRHKKSDVHNFLARLSESSQSVENGNNNDYWSMISDRRIYTDPVLFANTLKLVNAQNAGIDYPPEQFDSALALWRKEGNKARTRKEKKYLARARLYLEQLRNSQAFEELANITELADDMLAAGHAADRIQARMEQLLTRTIALSLAQDIAGLNSDSLAN